MAPDEHLEEILGGGGAELLHAEVFEHEEIDPRELLHQRPAGAGGVGLREVGREIEGAGRERAVAGTATSRQRNLRVLSCSRR